MLARCGFPEGSKGKLQLWLCLLARNSLHALAAGGPCILKAVIFDTLAIDFEVEAAAAARRNHQHAPIRTRPRHCDELSANLWAARARRR